jgi:hypothetical protein
MLLLLFVVRDLIDSVIRRYLGCVNKRGKKRIGEISGVSLDECPGDVGEQILSDSIMRMGLLGFSCFLAAIASN